MIEPQSRKPSKPSVSHDFFDYSSVVDFESRYAAQFYCDRAVNNDEKAVMGCFVPKLKEFAGKGSPSSSYLEIGCGPTLHHAIMVAPYVKNMVLSDFLEGNRKAVEQWRDNHPDALNWQQYTQFILETEQALATEQDVADREHRTREKILGVIPCNLMSSTVVQSETQYDLVGCFYCLEEVARTIESFRTMIANVASLIRPGGALMIAALRSTSFYHVRGDNGEEVEFPCLAVTESLVKQSLNDAGFEIRPGDVVSVDIEGQADEGIPGIILSFVEKRNPT